MHVTIDTCSFAYLFADITINKVTFIPVVNINGTTEESISTTQSPDVAFSLQLDNLW